MMGIDVVRQVRRGGRGAGGTAKHLVRLQPQTRFLASTWRFASVSAPPAVSDSRILGRKRCDLLEDLWRSLVIFGMCLMLCFSPSWGSSKSWLARQLLVFEGLLFVFVCQGEGRVAPSRMRWFRMMYPLSTCWSIAFHKWWVSTKRRYYHEDLVNTPCQVGDTRWFSTRTM